MNRLAAAWLPQPRILHPWPDQRFAVKQGRSPVPELGTPGSVRGVLSNGHSYRDLAPRPNGKCEGNF